MLTLLTQIILRLKYFYKIIDYFSINFLLLALYFLYLYLIFSLSNRGF